LYFYRIAFEDLGCRQLLIGFIIGFLDNLCQLRVFESLREKAQADPPGKRQEIKQ
jgi:hypothetical protein